MAGSYSHCVDDAGRLRDPEPFADMIENLGDAYEATEELYGMVWWLAARLSVHSGATPAELVEDARVNYSAGVELSPTGRAARY
jgi:hypothetical protein